MNGFFMYAYVSNQINRKYKSYWAYQFLPNLILANNDQIFKSRFIESQFLPIFCSTFWWTIFQIWCKLLKSSFFKSIFLTILHNFSIWHFCIKICDFFQIYKSTTLKCNVNTRKKRREKKSKVKISFVKYQWKNFSQTWNIYLLYDELRVHYVLSKRLGSITEVTSARFTRKSSWNSACCLQSR